MLSAARYWDNILWCAALTRAIQLLSGVVACSCVRFFFGWHLFPEVNGLVSLVPPTQLNVVRHKNFLKLCEKRHNISSHLCKEETTYMVLWLLLEIKALGFYFQHPCEMDARSWGMLKSMMELSIFFKEHAGLRVWLKSGLFKGTVAQLWVVI